MNSLRVLVAEDEPLARERLVRLLREGGCEILAELEDGASLVAWMAEHPDAPIDALFLDIQMPGITGLEALAELKNPPLTVFVTAHPGYALQAFDAAAIDYVLKPVALARFVVFQPQNGVRSFHLCRGLLSRQVEARCSWI